MTAKKRATDPEKPDGEKRKAPGGGGSSPEPSASDGTDWFSGINAGVQVTARKLLAQLPPEVRSKLMEQARQHGPRAALVAVDAAAAKARSPRAKLALRALSSLLRMAASKSPRP